MAIVLHPRGMTSHGEKKSPLDQVLDDLLKRKSPKEILGRAVCWMT